MLFDPGACCTCSSSSPVVGWYVRCWSESGTLPIAPPATGTPGITVALYSDSGRTALVASAVTDSTGRASMTGLSPGTYYRRVGGASPFGTYDPPGTVTLTATSNVGYSYNLVTDAGHACRVCCTDYNPLPSTLSASTTWGPCTLTLDPTKRFYLGTIPGVTYSTDSTNASGCPGVVTVTISLNIYGCTLSFSFPWGSNTVSTPDGYNVCPGAAAITSGGTAGIGSAIPSPGCGPGFAVGVGGSGTIASLALGGDGTRAMNTFYNSTGLYNYSITVTE